MKHLSTLVLTALFSVAAVTPALAAVVPAVDESTITVSASGSVSRAPDVASIEMLIESSSDTAARATLDNNNRYNDLVGKLLAIKFGREAVKTTSYGLDTVSDGTTKRTFVVRRTVSVRVDNIDDTGKAIDAATAAAVSSINGVSYRLRDPQSAYRAALAEAMATAQGNARALADAGHVRLVRIKSIVTYAAPLPGPIRPLARMASSNAAAIQLPTEVLPGDLTLSAQVNVVFIIGS